MTRTVRPRFFPSFLLQVACLLAAVSACSSAHVTEQPGDGGVGTRGGGGGYVGGGGSTGTAGSGSLGGGGATVSPADGGSGPTVDANCGLSTFMLERLPPDVVVVLDRSASMSQPAMFNLACFIMQCTSKWDDMTKALTATVTQTQAAVNWGLNLFPSDDGCGVSARMTAPVAPNNGMTVNAAIAAAAPGGNTPTRLALQATGTYMMGLGHPNPRYIVLATDGLPNCSDERGRTDDQATIAEVGALAAAGIPVFVIGVATQGADATLSAMAQAGGKPRAGMPSYYAVNTADDLTAALETIGGQIVSCTLPINQPPDPSNIAVDADGMRVPASATDGWTYGAGMTTIELRGSWCTNYQKGVIKDIKAIFGCPGIIIP